MILRHHPLEKAKAGKNPKASQQLLIFPPDPAMSWHTYGKYPTRAWAISGIHCLGQSGYLLPRRKDATKDWSEPARKSQRDLTMQNRDAFREKRLGFLFAHVKQHAPQTHCAECQSSISWESPDFSRWMRW